MPLAIWIGSPTNNESRHAHVRRWYQVFKSQRNILHIYHLSLLKFYSQNNGNECICSRQVEAISFLMIISNGLFPFCLPVLWSVDARRDIFLIAAQSHDGLHCIEYKKKLLFTCEMCICSSTSKMKAHDHHYKLLLWSCHTFAFVIPTSSPPTSQIWMQAK